MQIFILQVVLFQMLFLLVYEALLKNETFFTYNRYYLLVTSIVSLLLPLIKIEILAGIMPIESFSGISTIWLPELFLGTDGVVKQPAYNPQKEEEYSAFRNSFLIGVYALGVLATLFIGLKKCYNLQRMFSFKKIAALGKVNIIEVPNSSIACTFYNTIFLGAKLTQPAKSQILTHELVHVNQKHSLDLVYFELLKIIFWFNPLIYMYQNRITTLHEFIADAAVVKTTGKRSYYEQLLNNAFNTQNISFINQFFNHSLIKKRIVMLQKSKSKTISKFKYLVMLPLMALMLMVVACSEEKDPNLYETQEVPGELLVEISSFNSRTEEDSAKMTAAIEEMTNTDNITKVRITDGIKTILMTLDPETGTPNIVVENVEGNMAKIPEHKEGDPIPFAVIEQVPVFPGCEAFQGNEEKKKCMSEKIHEFVATNFDADLGKKLGLTGINRVIVIFKINSDGKITEVRARAPHPDLEEEAKRVIEGLPQMIPGEHNGKAVGVSYSLPIVFQVNE